MPGDGLNTGQNIQTHVKVLIWINPYPANVENMVSS